MKTKHIVAILLSLALVPMVTLVGFLIAGTKIPIGTFNVAERQRIEQRHSSKSTTNFPQQPSASLSVGSNNGRARSANVSPPTPSDAEYITGINASGTVRVNNFA